MRPTEEATLILPPDWTAETLARAAEHDPSCPDRRGPGGRRIESGRYRARGAERVPTGTQLGEPR